MVLSTDLELWAYSTNQAASIVVGQANMTGCNPNQGGSTAAYTLSYPWDIWVEGSQVFIADNFNSRILIYNSIPAANNTAANIVVGQPNMTSYAESNGGIKANTLDNPTRIFRYGTKLFIADTDNNRVLIYNNVPAANNAGANVVIGQPNMTSGDPNIDYSVNANTLYYPYGIWTNGTKLIIADYFNSRVLIYNNVPTANNASANVVIGQPNMTANSPNNGGIGAQTMDCPTGVYSDGTRLFVADYNNHRVLIFNTIPTANNAGANVVIGQANMTGESVNQGGSAGPHTLTYPNTAFSDGSGKLYISDKGNSRVLIYNSIPAANNASADVVLGQPDMYTNDYAASAVKMNSPCQAMVSGTRLYVADTFNHRALFFDDFTSTPTSTISPTPTHTLSATPSSSPTNSSTVTPTGTPTASPTFTPSATPTSTPTASPSFTPSASPTNSSTATPTASPTDSSTPTPTDTSSASPTFTPSATPSATHTATPTPSGTATHTLSPTPTLSGTATPTETASASPTNTLSATPTASSTCTATPSITATPTSSPTPTLSGTATPTKTFSPTVSASVTFSATPTVTISATASRTMTPTPTLTVSATVSWSPTITATLTPTPVWSPTQSATPIPTTPSQTPTGSENALTGFSVSLPHNPVRFSRGEKADIRLNLPAPGFVKMHIYNLSGRKMAALLNENISAGVHRLVWDDPQAGSGMYIIFYETPFGRGQRKLVIIH